MMRSWVAALLLAALFTVAMSGLMVARFDGYRAFNQDFAYRLQGFWNFQHGRGLVETIYGGHLFQFHFEPIILALIPLFAAAGERPEALLVLQALAVAMSGLVLFRFAAVRIGPRTGLLLLLIYYLYPPLQFGAVFNFTPLVLALPLLMMTVTALEEKRHGVLVMALGGALWCQEYVAYLGIALGLAVLIGRRHWRLGIGVTLGSALLLCFSTAVLLPSFSSDPRFAGTHEIDHWWYGHLDGGSPLDRITRAVATLLQPATAVYLFRLLGPLWLIPLLAPRPFLLFLAAAIPLLITRFEFTRQIWAYYQMPLLPFLFVAFVIGLARLRGKLAARPAGYRLLLFAILATVAANCWFESPARVGGRPFIYYPGIYANPRQAALDAAVAAVPDEASVLTIPVLAEHFFRRPRLNVIFKENLLDPREEYIVMDLREFNWIVDIEPSFVPPWLQTLKQVIRQGRYEVVCFRDGVLVLRRTGTMARRELTDDLRAEFDDAFRKAFRALGYSGDAERPALCADAERWPGKLPIYRAAPIRFPVTAGGYWEGQRRFERLLIHWQSAAGARGQLATVDPVPDDYLLELDLTPLPEGNVELTVTGFDGAETQAVVLPITVDRTPPLIQPTWYQIAAGPVPMIGDASIADTISVCEAWLVADNVTKGEVVYPLSRPIERRWIGMELIDIVRPIPGGTERTWLKGGQWGDSYLRVGGVHTVVARDYAGNESRLDFRFADGEPMYR